MELNEYRQDATTPKTHRTLKMVLIAIGAVIVLTAGTFTGSALLTDMNVNNALHAREAAQAAVPAAPAGSATTATSQAQMATSDLAGAQAVVTENAKLVAAALAAKEAAAKAAAIRAADEQQTPTLCPSGTIAGAVDGNGNQSECQPENGSGEVCQAYNDANQCTAWGKP